MQLPHSTIGAHAITMDHRAAGNLLCQELISGYIERVGMLVPKPKSRENWSNYLNRVARVVREKFQLLRIWDALESEAHDSVKVQFYNVTSNPGQTSKVIAEVAVKSGALSFY